jgi:cold shock CspA family protein
MKGKIYQWKDDRGFGFIQPEDGSEKVFFHISVVKTNARRPQVGDSVFFEPTRDGNQKRKARGVVIEGVSQRAQKTYKSSRKQIEGPKKGIVDYICIFTILAAVGAIGVGLYWSREIGDLWPFGVVTAVAFLILNRQKKPEDNSFNCAGCGCMAHHEKRTIRAWNNGFTKFYCKACHLQWLKDNPKREINSTFSTGDGCLGVVAIMVLIPVLSSIALYQWFV